MPRQARIFSDTGVYRIMMRGNDKGRIFLDDDDRRRFISTLFEKASEENTDIYAYCLMSNHVHLLMKEGNEDMGTVFKRIGSSYVYWYNWKYNRRGC